MHVQINTDHNIEAHEALMAHVQGMVSSSMRHFGDHITRVEVHLSDQNGDKAGGGDKRCLMEARLEGRQPKAVTHSADTMEKAILGAAEKLSRAVQHAVEKQHEQR